jgi:hypothetical protein
MKLKLLLTLTLVIVFSWLFWHQTPGINILVYVLIVAGFVLITNPRQVRNATVLLFLAGAIVSSIMVYAHGPGWALFTAIVSLFLFVTSVYMSPLNIPLSLGAQSVVSLVLAPLVVMRISKVSKALGISSSGSAMKWIRLVIVPLLALVLFYILYLIGSPHFRKANEEVIDVVVKFLEEISWQYFFFICWGIWMAVYMMSTPSVNTGLGNGQKFLQRVKSRFQYNPGKKLHYRMLSGVILFSMLNLLLAVVNWIDIKTLWISFQVPENFSLMDFVHAGMWVLSFCIILSVIIVAIYFKGNLNFYSRSKPLKVLSMIWIVQNIVLTYSVFLRDWYYISWHGLAYGRIFLLFVLALIAFSLVMILLKVLKKYSSHHLYRMNSWFGYALLVGASLVDWDLTIIRHNLDHPNSGQIDYAFYLRVSPDHYPLIKANEAKVNHQIAMHRQNKVRWVNYDTEKSFWQSFQWRSEDALREEAAAKWQSYVYNRRANLHGLQMCTAQP